MKGAAEQLADAGMSEAEADSKGRLFERAVRVLTGSSIPGRSLRAYYVPGRIEVLGKHTDYGGGRSLLCTVERGFCLVAAPRQDSEVHVINARSRAACTLALDPNLSTADRRWCTYPGTVVRRLARNFPSARKGADIAFISDLPAASGMSSSSAFIVAVFLALADVNALADNENYQREIQGLEDLAAYLGTLENGQSYGTLAGDHGVGTFGGSEDHTAILCSRSGHLKQYSFCPIRHELTVAMPEQYLFALAVSGVTAIKTGGARAKYNRASLAARRVLDLWCQATGRSDPTLAAAANSSTEAPDRIRAILRASKETDFSASELANRFDQFHEESEVIIPSATKALLAADPVRFGVIVERSQQRAEKLLGNQVPETIALVRSARSLGAAAASAFGAGFGGSVWAMVPVGQACRFERLWASRFCRQFPASKNARFFSTHPGPAAMRIQPIGF